MPAVPCRLLPYAEAGGPANMAADETLLHSALSGTASLRFYGWTEPTLSLGYFQPERLRHDDPLLAALPFVRRPTGGDTLVHHHEVTYALALPPGAAWQGGEPWLPRLHAVIADALAGLGVAVRLCDAAGQRRHDGPLCFRHFTSGDLLRGDAKVVGSAQRRHRGALLQHGAILLARSPHTPALPGIRELTGRCLSAAETAEAVRAALVRRTGWLLEAAEWTADERQRQAELVAGKYVQASWNGKR
jgi:lipoate-protein ligase A